MSDKKTLEERVEALERKLSAVGDLLLSYGHVHSHPSKTAEGKLAFDLWNVLLYDKTPTDSQP